MPFTFGRRKRTDAGDAASDPKQGVREFGIRLTDDELGEVMSAARLRIAEDIDALGGTDLHAAARPFVARNLGEAVATLEHKALFSALAAMSWGAEAGVREGHDESGVLLSKGWSWLNLMDDGGMLDGLPLAMPEPYGDDAGTWSASIPWLYRMFGDRMNEDLKRFGLAMRRRSNGSIYVLWCSPVVGVDAEPPEDEPEHDGHDADEADGAAHGPEARDGAVPSGRERTDVADAATGGGAAAEPPEDVYRE